MNSTAVITLTGTGDTLEEAVDMADERMNDFLKDDAVTKRIVINISSQVLFANYRFFCALTILYRF